MKSSDEVRKGKMGIDKLITTISQIDAALDEPGFWTLEKLQILDLIHTQAKDERKVPSTLLDRLNRPIAERLSALTGNNVSVSSLSVGQQHLVNALLEQLQAHGWQVRFYSLPVKKIRPPTLPTDAHSR